MDTQLVVIGAGPGGYTAAFLAADLGMQVSLVDMEPRLGGVCLLRGCIPSKALLHVTKAMAEARELAGWGVTFSDPKIEIDVLRGRKEKVIATLAGGLAELAKRRGVRLIRARAAFEDSQTLRLEPVGDEKQGTDEAGSLGSGRSPGAAEGSKHSNANPPQDGRLRFEHCILATGSSPARIPAMRMPSARVMDSTGALELAGVPEAILIVGGGYIGLELGTVYAALGSRVSVVELTDGLLPGADRDLVKPLQKRLESRFSAIYLNTKVVAMTETKDSVEVAFEGDRAETQRFSQVLVSVGRRPNSAGLGLENTKVQIDARGFVLVDKQQRTTDRSIFAIGDVAGEPMLAHKAARQAKVAVEALAGQQAAFDPRAIPAVVFTDPEIAWAGLTETDARRQGRPVEVAVFPWAASGRAQAVGRPEGLTKWLIEPESQRVIGCGIVGAGAGELIGEAVLAIEMGASLRDVAESIHPHPTLSETLAGAAEVFLGTATDLYRPKQKA